MAKIFYLHWHEAEARERVAPLLAAGYQLSVHWSQEKSVTFGEALPEALVISLDRLPSHGRAVAEWFWEAKKRQHIPIIFAGGQPDKVKVAKARFPKAIFCATEEVPAVLARCLKGK
ncbi:MAG: hypothetical protein ONB48_20970 [candidate division KSB1 bacterium]|nr:hypothetical protein [candidate division KSB1 bacterium]MDZ7276452.1 hypothetical protein [candidate division KSB1 bacterium]MDZ7288121.1 hypothetical protein [candidate division KSB1 bacterium]MDZ7300222.1 hypothetical protein [candidate division KSB1 bacterium]MDZ7309133.1 hypothetical protein [candidate division KSB1 bacterium]